MRARGEDPYISYIGNLNPATLEREATDPNFFGEWEWHTDMSYIEVPPDVQPASRAPHSLKTAATPVSAAR